MEEMQQITLDQWLSWKEDIREKLRETSENFVHIGYRLKQIRDSGMYNGEADIFGFAMKEYGLSKSTTSRFIAINERFSEGGNSLELRQEYKALGSSKLAEMLALPDTECQMITERTTVKEIRELKEFSRQQASEQEDGEGGTGVEEKKLTPLQKCLVDYFRDKREMLNAVIRAYREDALKMAAEVMNPSGYATHKKGLCYLFMYEYERGAAAKIMTAPEPRIMSWEELLGEVDCIFGGLYESGGDDVHGAYYGSNGGADENGLVQAPDPEEDKPETAESQDEGASVATSQREAESENVSEISAKDEDPGEDEPASDEADYDTAEDAGEPDQDVEGNEAPKGPEAAESQDGEASVATSQRDGEKEDKASETDVNIGALWFQIADLEMEIGIFVESYDETKAADGGIPLDELRTAYKKTIDMAAGMERLLMIVERGIGADE